MPCWILLILIVGTSVAVRAMQAFEGLPYLHYWDEPFVASRALHMMKTGTLDPNSFVYGSLTIYLSMMVDVFHYLWLMSRPETSPPFLSHIDQITTYFDTGWLWEVSHPSFYLWNRWVAAIIGTGTVLLVYLIGRRIAGRWAGMAAAALLAGLGFHVEQSAINTVDNPMTFLVILTGWAAVVFIQEGRPGSLIASMAACGLAISTKYNAAVALCLPVVALAWKTPELSPRRRRSLWLAIPFVPVLAFIVASPYAVLNLRQFLIDVGKAVSVYEVRPLAQAAVNPGWEHLTLQAGRFSMELGLVALMLALAGMVLMATRRAGGTLLLFGVLYALFMGASRLSYHRNFLVLYPITAVAFGTGSVFLVRFTGNLGRQGPRAARHARGVIVALLVGFLGFGLVSAARRGMDVWLTPESRSETIDVLSRDVMAVGEEETRVAIPEELRLHPDDLARLDIRNEEAPYLELLCTQDRYTHFLIPTRWSNYARSMRWKADLFNSTAPAGATMLGQIRSRAPLVLDSPSPNPGVMILALDHSTADGTRTCLGAFEPGDLTWDGLYEVNSEGELVMFGDGTSRTPWVIADAGSYALVWDARGTQALGEFAKVRTTAFWRFTGAEPETLEQRTFELTLNKESYAMEFDVPEAGVVSAHIEFINDYYSKATRTDRNVYLSALYIIRLERDVP